MCSTCVYFRPAKTYSLVGQERYHLASICNLCWWIVYFEDSPFNYNYYCICKRTRLALYVVDQPVYLDIIRLFLHRSHSPQDSRLFRLALVSILLDKGKQCIHQYLHCLLTECSIKTWGKWKIPPKTPNILNWVRPINKSSQVQSPVLM